MAGTSTSAEVTNDPITTSSVPAPANAEVVVDEYSMEGPYACLSNTFPTEFSMLVESDDGGEEELVFENAQANFEYRRAIFYGYEQLAKDILIGRDDTGGNEDYYYRAYGAEVKVNGSIDFGHKAVEVMIEAIRQKVIENDHVRATLMATGTSAIIYKSSDPVWGVGTGGGLNIVGRILVLIREDYAHPATDWESYGQDYVKDALIPEFAHLSEADLAVGYEDAIQYALTMHMY